MSVVEEIERLKKEKHAVILAHYYVDDDVQAIADYVGDSFYLSKVATTIDAEYIVLAGVSFMGESAKILNPTKKVLLPDSQADCYMAHMVDLNEIKYMREKYEDLAVVCYINSTAEIKAYADVCVTSANAVKIVSKLPYKNIFFIPDGNLGRYVAGKVPEKNIICNNGFCPVHNRITVQSVEKTKKEHPDAQFLAHPECRQEILAMADYIGSTSGIINYATESDNDEFIIGTECGVFYQLQKSNPGKKFYSVMNRPTCVNMKKVTLEKIRDVLEKESNEVFIDEELRLKALKPLQKMLELG